MAFPQDRFDVPVAQRRTDLNACFGKGPWGYTLLLCFFERRIQVRPLLITMGDPCGIGPELIIKTFLHGDLRELDHPLQVVGDIGVLNRAAAIFTKTIRIEKQNQDRHTLLVDDRRIDVRVLLQPRSGQAALRPPRPRLRHCHGRLCGLCPESLAGERLGRRHGDRADQQGGH